MACGRCKAVPGREEAGLVPRYCSRECQTSAWPGHKLECGKPAVQSP
jgi:hypothetical protein